MENLNAEQVKKALSVCWDTTCSDCEFDSNCGGHWQVLENAFVLINSYEQKIEELTEENKALFARNLDLAEKGEKVVIAYKELSEENERLRERNITLEQKLMLLGIDDVYVFKAQVKGE
jgi:hypothetical protein